MINKYALGTVVGAALLALAKSKLGSGAQMKKGYKETFEVTIDFYLDENDFLPLQERQDILDQIKSIVESYGSIVDGIEFREIELAFGGNDYLMQIDISKTHFSERQIQSYVMNDFESEFYKTADKIHFMLKENNILPDDFNVGITNDYISGHPYIQNQSGEWVPYSKSELHVTKLRKR